MPIYISVAKLHIIYDNVKRLAVIFGSSTYLSNSVPNIIKGWQSMNLATLIS